MFTSTLIPLTLWTVYLLHILNTVNAQHQILITQHHGDIMYLRSTVGFILRVIDESNPKWTDEAYKHLHYRASGIRAIVHDKARFTNACNHGLVKEFPAIDCRSLRPLLHSLENLPKSERALHEGGILLLRMVKKTKLSNYVKMSSFSQPESIDMGQFPYPVQVLIKGFLSRYVDDIGITIKRNLIAAYMELPFDADTITMIVSVLQDAGPGLQKMFQLVGDKISDPELRRAAERFKSGIKPMKTYQLQKALRRAFKIESVEQLIPRYFSSFDWNSVNAASISQGHRAILPDGKKVFIKVKRPELKEKLLAEVALLKLVFAKDIRNNPNINSEDGEGALRKMTQLVESWEEEIDLGLEAKNTWKATELYRMYLEKGIEVVKIINTYPEEDPNVLIMSVAPGSTVNAFEPKPQYKGQDVCALLHSLTLLFEMFLTEALFKSGFYHGDLQGGNYLFDYQENIGSRLTLIDFGNAHTADADQLSDLYIGVAINAFTRNADGLISVLMRATTMDDEFKNWEPLRNDLKMLFQREKVFISPVKLTQLAFETIAQHSAIPLPPSVLFFIRSYILIQSQLERVMSTYGNELETNRCGVNMDKLLLTIFTWRMNFKCRLRATGYFCKSLASYVSILKDYQN